MKKKLLIVLLPLLMLVGIGAGGFYYINSKIYVPNLSDTAQSITSESKSDDLNYQEEKGMHNILLLGLDGRDKESDSRTDSMIMATLDTNNKKVKLTSFMRDMYVPIPNHSQNKINSAFFLGGPQLLMDTINQDFNTKVQYYVSIDFRAFQGLVEKLGGIEVEVKEYEVEQINKYVKEANWHNPEYIEGAGLQHLNGQQALSYCRIRKVGNNDYERTERQRKVLALLIDKARKTSVFKLPELFSSIIPYIKTNIPATKLLNLAYTVYKFGDTHIESIRIPGDGMFEEMNIEGSSCLVPDIEKNVAYLDNFLYSTGMTNNSNTPVYMANDFHANDKSIDKRGIKRNTVRINIDKEKINNVDNVDNSDNGTSNLGNEGKVQNTNKKKKRNVNQNTKEQTIEIGDQEKDSIINTENPSSENSTDSSESNLGNDINTNNP